MEQPKKKVVLAFSGGLDTSFCAKYLSEDLGYEVHKIGRASCRERVLRLV